MASKRVTVLGANSYVASYVLYLLAKKGYECIVPLSHPQRFRDLKFSHNVHLVKTDCLNPRELSVCLKGSSVVINFFQLYNLPHHTKDQLDLFNHIFCKLLVQLSIKNRVDHLIDRSTLGIDQLVLTNPYWQTKLYGSKALIANSGIRVTLIKPSWVYGESVSFNEHCFLQSAYQSLQHKKFYPIVGHNVALRPIHIRDLSQLFVDTVHQSPPSHQNQKIEAYGKDSYRLGELIRTLHQRMNSSTTLYNLPDFLGGRAAKKRKGSGSFFPLGTHNFNLSLDDSSKASTSHEKKIFIFQRGVDEYVNTLAYSTSLNGYLNDCRKFSKR